MENRNQTKRDSSPSSGPSLSQYFANDPPSFFDELSTTNRVAEETSFEKYLSQSRDSSSLMSSNFNGTSQASNYLEVDDGEIVDDIQVPDDVRDAWRTEAESGKPPFLTMPGIRVLNDLPDPIREAVLKHLGEEELAQRKILTSDNVTQDERGIRQLIACGCYRSAVNLTGRLLTVYGQGYGRAGQPAKHTPHSLQLWFTRLALLVKLGEYELLRLEAEPFKQLDHPDVFYDFYPEMYKNKTGSIACFSFRLLLAEVPIYFGDAKKSLNHLAKIYLICNLLIDAYEGNENAQMFWKRRRLRVLCSIINGCISMKGYDLVETIMEIILNKHDLSKEERRAIYSAWGRIYLQIGDIFGAEQKFSEAKRLKSSTGSSSPDLRDLVDKGIITVAKNDFQEAFITFQKALHLESGNTMILNNMGACLLYAGKLKDAINLFERAISLNPQKSLNESLLVNLSTLYELESNNSTSKKLNLLRLINKHKPDMNISLEICLKLQST